MRQPQTGTRDCGVGSGGDVQVIFIESGSSNLSALGAPRSQKKVK